MTADGQIKSFFERWENLEGEKKQVADLLKDLFAEAKGFGYDTKALRAAFRLKVKEDLDNPADAEFEAVVDTYLNAINAPSISVRDARMRVRENIGKFDAETGEILEDVNPRLAKQVVDGMQTGAGRAALMAAVDIMIEREEADEPNSRETAVHDKLETVAQSPRNAEDELVGPEKGTAEAGGSGQPDAIPVLTGQHPGANVSGLKRAGVTAGETAPQSELATASQGEAEAPSAERVSPRSETDTGSAAANIGGDHVDDHQSAATPAGALVSNAPAARVLRPHCQRPEMCGSGTRDHCWNCKKAIREGEAA